MNKSVGRQWLLSAVSVLCVFAARDTQAATTLVHAGDNLQAALNAAQPGDTLLLEAGATFTGNFVLPVKTGNLVITVSTAPDPRLPAQGIRISPAHAPLLARIRSGNAMAALRTAPGAHHWRLVLLEFAANRDGYGDIIQLGDGSPAQNHLSLVPFEIELDRVYVHGDPVKGQKRGIALNASAITIHNSYIADIRGVGMDTQAIGGWNGPGPFRIENNYLEAAGENFMLGGADPAIPNLVSEAIVIRRNHMSRPMAWRNPVVPTPSNLTALAQTGGSLSAGTHSYRIVARTPVSNGVIARSAASEEIAVNAPAGGRISLSWTPVPHAAEYDVYRRSPAGDTQYWNVASAAFVDTGTPGTARTPPTSAGSAWTVKNILELKNARNVVIEQNVFENHWAGAQAGYAIVFTPRNQDGACTWCVVEDVTFRHNVVRNSSGGINILGYDDLAPSRQTNGIRVTGNLFARITRTLGGNGWFLLLGNGPRDITVDHNTIDADGTTVSYVYGPPGGGVLPVSGFRFTNNAARHGEYGMNGAEVGFGNAIISAYFPDGEVKGNWLQGGYAPRYPEGNYFERTFASAFANLPGSDYSPALDGPLANRATDGSHIGANAASLSAMVQSVAAGTRNGPTPPANLRVITR